MPPRKIRPFSLRNVLALATVAVLLIIYCVWLRAKYQGQSRTASSSTPLLASRLNESAPEATWPWPEAVEDRPYPGMTHWKSASAADGTTLDLVEFNFAANSGLRLELYDQDEDDAIPYDDSVDHWPHGIGWATRHLSGFGRGKVIAVWNGLFFATDHRAGGALGVARHLAPVVVNGRAYYNVGNHRWAFGIKYSGNRRELKVLHLPDRATLEREFTYAAGGAQCLIREGKPLKLWPFPSPGELIPKGPFPSTPDEAGHIPVVDHMKTSRTCLGWTRDNRHLYLLIVKEPDTEMESALALRHGQPGTGGWTIADLQRFWISRKVWGAVNLDGGGMTQMTCLMKDGSYEMVPPEWATRKMRFVFPPTFPNAPAGGTLMYFYVRDTGRKLSRKPARRKASRPIDFAPAER